MKIRKLDITRSLSAVLLMFTFFVLGFRSSAQLTSSFQGVQGSAKYGFILPHRSTMGHLLRGHTTAVELGYTFQMDGSEVWHQHFNLPSVSFTLNYMDFGYKKVLGNSVGTQIVTFLPYFRKNGWSFGSRLGAGLGVTTEKFDQDLNPKNNAIGSYLNAFVTFGLKLEKQFRQNSFGLEVNMSHLSNGAYKLPNLGLNMPLIGLQYTHYFEELDYREPKAGELPQVSATRLKWNWFSQLIVSSKQIYPTGGSNYGIVSLTNFVQFAVGPKCIIEGGADAIYNQSIIRDVPGDYGAEKNFQLGTYLGYVLPVHNLDFLVGMGRYVHNPLDPKGMWYHKLGSRIRLTDRIQANIVIKAHWAKADYFEYGITYQW